MAAVASWQRARRSISPATNARTRAAFCVVFWPRHERDVCGDAQRSTPGAPGTGRRARTDLQPTPQMDEGERRQFRRHAFACPALGGQAFTETHGVPGPG